MKKVTWTTEIVSFLGTLAVSVLLVFGMVHFIARPVRIEGNSMYPTLHDQDLAFSSVMNLKQNDLRRFDTVVIRLEQEDKYIVKRIIGLPLETVEIRNDRLYINHQYVEESFLDPTYKDSQRGFGSFTNDLGPITLGADEFYALGDNRPNSQDSRFYGPFSTDQIVSRHFFIIYPLNRIRFKQ